MSIHSFFVVLNHNNCIFKAFGDVFAGIGVREPQPRASEAFTRFGETHRNMEKLGFKFLKTVKPVNFFFILCIIFYFISKILIMIFLDKIVMKRGRERTLLKKYKNAL